jgi:LuxR family maltose regulon positive regulatory protein
LHATRPDLISLLHKRASGAYEAAGAWREAIAHLLTAADYPGAAKLMEQAASEFWLRGEASTVYAWVLALPDAVLWEHSRLALTAALRLLNSVHMSTQALYTSAVAQVERLLSRLQELLRHKVEGELMRAEYTVIERRLSLLRASIEGRSIYRHGDIERLRRLTAELDLLPRDEEGVWNMIPLSLTVLLVMIFQQDGIPLLERLQREKQRVCEEGDRLVMLRVMNALMQGYIFAGRLHRAYQEGLEIQALIEQFDGQTVAAWQVHTYLFKIYYTWNRLDEAEETLQRMIAFGQQWQQVEMLLIAEISQVQIGIARGNLALAQEALPRLEALVNQEKFANHADWLIFARVSYWLAAGKFQEANDWAARSTFSLHNWSPLLKEEALMLVRILLVRQDYARAVEMLQGIGPHYDRSVDVVGMLDWMALLVVALFKSGQHEQAADIAVRMFALTEPEDNIRVYLDLGKQMKETLAGLLAESKTGALARFGGYMSRLVAIFEQDKKQCYKSNGTDLLPIVSEAISDVEVYNAELTRQELKVLRLLVAGQTYTEMAETLVVSLNTIKTQVSSIYRKLGVSRRSQAIVAAQRFLIGN